MREKLMQAVIFTLLLKIIAGINPPNTTQTTLLPWRQPSMPIVSLVQRLPQ